MDFTISSNEILALCGLIASLWGVYKIVKEVKKPSEDLKATVEEHGQCIEDDHGRLKALEESNKMILQCLLVIINHDITGNCIDRMKYCRDELQEFLIKK